MTTSATLSKCPRVQGHRIVLRDAVVDDAAFILSLRTDETKNRFLSRVDPALAPQQAWLERYATSTDQAYFIIEDLQGQPFGTVRLYDPRGSSFCWGSWLLVHGAPAHFSIESALVVYHYGLHLGFDAAHFDVRKGNRSVWQFHERFGAVKTGETEEDYLYAIDRLAIERSLARYAKFLPHGIRLG